VSVEYKNIIFPIYKTNGSLIIYGYSHLTPVAIYCIERAPKVYAIPYATPSNTKKKLFSAQILLFFVQFFFPFFP